MDMPTDGHGLTKSCSENFFAQSVGDLANEFGILINSFWIVTGRFQLA